MFAMYNFINYKNRWSHKQKMDVFSENSRSISDCNNTFTKDHKNIALIAKSGTSLVSFSVCLIAVSLVVCLRLYKYFTYRLAMYQILSSLCLHALEASYLTLLNYDDDIYQQVACKTTAFLDLNFIWIELLFTICLIFHLFCLAVCLKNFQKLEIVYVLFSILFPLLFSWIPFIHNSYGVAGAWCWIRDWKDDCATQKYIEGIIEQFVLWFVPLFFFLTISVVAAFIMLVIFAKRSYAHRNQENEFLLENHDRNRNKKAMKELLPLLAYPVIFYVLSLFPLIDRVYSAISSTASFELVLVHAITESLSGFFSSWALIIHILVMRQLNKKQFIQYSISTKRINNSGNHIFTIQTEGSANATRYSIPAESDIDND